MSTFGGVMVEFPDIRVDYFSRIPDMRPPLACFLSHVHTDHLAGLESFKSPFLYCSAATKELLLRLERYPHRINFAKGILESRKQQYKHLQNLLKPIPLETPTCIELEPGNEIQVTLFDANHCTGAVMFLFEGGGKAVLYTGDIRSEPWFVNSLTRNPFLIEYTSGLKVLDCIYLDTSNLEPIKFPPKADGLRELLQKVSKYPKDTTFHFRAWTFGYEEVWMALSKALNSPIHVDRYKLKLYEALRGNPASKEQHSGHFIAAEGPVLAGYTCGNTAQPGCLTSEINVRLHSCEKGLYCTNINANTVFINPIITRTKIGTEVAEMGIGGGGGDLNQHPELLLESDAIISQLVELFKNTEDDVLQEIKDALHAAYHSRRQALSLGDMELNRKESDLSLTEFTEFFTKSLVAKRSPSLHKSQERIEEAGSELPKTITFPYSRHSSYHELCDLVKAFEPLDVYPCTVHERKWQQLGYTIKTLFGHVCSGTRFRHDAEMLQLFPDEAEHLATQKTQTTDSSQPSQPPQTSSPLITNMTVEPSRAPYSNGSMRENADTLGMQNPISVERAREALEQGGGNVNTAQAILDLEMEQYRSRSIAEKAQLAHSQSLPTADTPRNCTMISSKSMDMAAAQEIITLSPNSQSQNLRRSAILEGLNYRPAKRFCLHRAGPGSSPSHSPEKKTSVIDLTGSDSQQQFHDSHQSTIFSSWVEVDVQGSRGSLVQNEDGAQPKTDAMAGNENNVVVDESVSEERPDDTINWGPWNEDAIEDKEDEIYRCSGCGHELWTYRGGYCLNECNSNRWPSYFEVFGPEQGARPEMAVDEDTNLLLGPRDRRKLVGNYLDDDSSAYDSQDSDLDFNEEYELDSFIDDGPQEGDLDESSESDDDDSSDGETDYKAKYLHLHGLHHLLIRDHIALHDEFDDFRRDMLSSAYESEDEDDVDMEVYNEHGLIVVNAPAPDPIITELVLSQVADPSEESDESEIDEARIRVRAEAFQKAGNGAWHEVSMVSVGDNHTHEELIL